jgi:AcrR family transcriptional regulator
VVSERRIGGPDAKNRDVLLDAAEQLMIEEGYAAVTSRRVASKAGLKSQLVHYYFHTMDDLFLALFQRRAEEGLRRQQELLAEERPLHALWDFSTDNTSAAFTMEMSALANHRKTIQAEVVRYSEAFRAAQLAAVTAILKRYQIPPDVCSPAVLVVLMTAVGRITGLEQNMGFSLGHKETLAWLEHYVSELEDTQGKARRATRKKRGDALI